MATMKNPLDVRTSPKFTLWEMAGVGVVKSVSERALAKTPVGNGTLKSGLLKLAGAGIVYGTTKNKNNLLGKVGQVTSTAWTVDGVEDLINGAMNYWMSRRGSSSMESAPSTI